MRGIVGRAAELSVVEDAVTTVARGHGLVLAISGEPGVGKTHLAGEALRLAGDAGFRLLRGTCARYQQDVSYGPLLQALRPLVDPAEPGGRERLAGLAELARLFTGLDLPEPGPPGEPGHQRGRMFDAVHTLMLRVSAAGPLALLIDDVHWADPGTLDLLAYLALGLGEHPCLFVVTDRTDPADAVRRFRTPLRRADRVIDVRLGPLAPGEVAALVDHLLPGEPPRPLLELLDRRARGIPLYVTSLVASLRAQGRLFRSGGQWVLGPARETDLTDDLTDLIADRLDDLGPPDLDVLAALGVWGDEATREMIGALVADDRLAEYLDRLVEAGLVDEQVTGTVTYRAHHPLVVEAARSRLSARERRLQHAAAARHLLDRPDRADPRMIAHHVRLAGPAFDPARALDILTSAVDADTADRSGQETLLLAEATVALIRECGRTELLPSALERMAAAAALAGDTPGASAAWRDAVTAHGPDISAGARCRRRLALLLLEQGDHDGAQRVLDEALAAVVDDPAAVRERYRVLQLRATFSLRAADRARYRQDVTALRPAADQVGLSWVADVFERYVDAGSYRMLLPSASIDLMTIAGQVAASLHEDDQTLATPWHRPWIVDAIARGDLAEAGRRIRQVPERDAVAPGTFSAAIALDALREWLAGSWERAFRLTGESLVTAHRHGNNRSVALALTTRALVLAHRGELDRAEDCCTDARAIFGRGDLHAVSTIDTVEAAIALLRGHPDDALTALGRSSPINYFGLLTLSVHTTAAARADSRELLDHLATEFAAIGGAWGAALGRRVDGLRDGDPDALSEAASQLTALDMPYESALVLLERAERHPAEIDPIEITGTLSALDGLGARPAADRARQLLRRLGHRPPPGPRSGGRLSEREAQVAELATRGLSNAEIAGQLFISQRTVTTHLERIYRRLGISSRRELSRYVTDNHGTGTGNT